MKTLLCADVQVVRLNANRKSLAARSPQLVTHSPQSAAASGVCAHRYETGTVGAFRETSQARDTKRLENKAAANSQEEDRRIQGSAVRRDRGQTGSSACSQEEAF